MTSYYEAALAAYRAQFPKMTEMWPRLPADDPCDGRMCFPADDLCDEWPPYQLEHIMTIAPEWTPRPDRLYRFFETTAGGKTSWVVERFRK